MSGKIYSAARQTMKPSIKLMKPGSPLLLVAAVVGSLFAALGSARA
jgi:hypothetical protein